MIDVLWTYEGEDVVIVGSEFETEVVEDMLLTEEWV